MHCKGHGLVSVYLYYAPVKCIVIIANGLAVRDSKFHLNKKSSYELLCSVRQKVIRCFLDHQHQSPILITLIENWGAPRMLCMPMLFIIKLSEVFNLWRPALQTPYGNSRNSSIYYYSFCMRVAVWWKCRRGQVRFAYMPPYCRPRRW